MLLVQKVEMTLEDSMAIYRCQTASQVLLFVGFLISWISLPTKTTKIGTPRIKVISQYLKKLAQGQFYKIHVILMEKYYNHLILNIIQRKIWKKCALRTWISVLLSIVNMGITPEQNTRILGLLFYGP